LLDNFANFVNNYKTKHKIFILSTIRCFETTTIVFEVIVSISLVNIIVLVLLLKKRSRLSKITKNAFISKKRNRLSKIKITTNNKKTTISKYYFNIIVVNIQELITINYLFRYNIKQL